MNGYLHPDYAASLSEFGTPRNLPACQGWILERPIPGFSLRDAMGCYPLFACQNWGRLKDDLVQLAPDLVTLALITDPFGDYTMDDLEHAFDRVVPFKEHFVVDLCQEPERFVSSHHRRNVQRAFRHLEVTTHTEPLELIDEWMKLYEVLTQRHRIHGFAAFSRESFIRQLQVPGIVAFCASREQQIVGMTLWYICGKVAYYHLGAYNPHGYKLLASFALFWHSFTYFKDRSYWLSLGAAAGSTSQEASGLTRFKKGWATDTRTVYFCSRIFDPKSYTEIVRTKGVPKTDYFPAYRQGDFS
jgi:hypothetical protein